MIQLDRFNLKTINKNIKFPKTSLNCLSRFGILKTKEENNDQEIQPAHCQ